MMSWVLLTVAVVSAEPTLTPEQTQLLKTFRQEFVHITPGQGRYPRSFEMGDARSPAARPVHTVTMKHDFFMARYEVPQNLWEAVLGKNPSKWKGPRNSVEMFTFDRAVEFCKRATQQMRAAGLIQKNQEIRLPSEAEWEYCARAGTTTRYSFGDEEKRLTDYGWYTGNASGNDPPVGVKRPNPWGLYDMHGYLWEWCADAGHENYKGAPTDGSAWQKGGDDRQRVIRGGSWKDAAAQCTSACRSAAFRSGQGVVKLLGGIPRDTRDDAIGLRCVLATVIRK